MEPEPYTEDAAPADGTEDEAPLENLPLEIQILSTVRGTAPLGTVVQLLAERQWHRVTFCCYSFDEAEVIDGLVKQDTADKLVVADLSLFVHWF